MSKFTHEGVDIILNSAGKFVATVAGNLLTKDTLSAMKKCIDRDKQSGFKPFVVIGSKSYGGVKIAGLKEHTRLTVIGVKTEKRRDWPSKRYWIVEGGDVIQWSDVYKDCPEVIELLKTEEAIREKHDAEEEAFNKSVREVCKKQEKYVVKPE